MDYFDYKDGILFAEDTAVPEIARAVGTPFYCYSARTIREHYKRIVDAFSGVELMVAFSIKAASSLAVLDMLKNEGSGFDVVSGGELYRAKKIGADPKKIVFAGVGKTREEIGDALEWGIGLFNVESPAELRRIAGMAAERGVTAGCALRVNPDVDPKTHKYITTGKRENKFGMDFQAAGKLLEEFRDSPSVRVNALHMHIGSQITEINPYVEALERLTAFIDKMRRGGFEINTVNIGGGFGVFYHGDEAHTAAEFAERIVPLVKKAGCRLITEPGRFIMGNAGILVTEVQYLKKTGAKTFVIVDTGMQHLLRPALYQAFHRIERVENPDSKEKITVDVVGPVCESSDVLAGDREISAVSEGDLLSVFSAGAYGFTMASNYNSHRRPAEVLVDGGKWEIIRERESYEDLLRGERIP